MGSTVTDDGQVILPDAIREALGLAPGENVEFEVIEPGRVVMSRARLSARERVQRIRGLTRGGLSTDEVLAMTRGDAP
jgi:AbrB family looped-hinge helix DNA binding protein